MGHDYKAQDYTAHLCDPHPSVRHHFLRVQQPLETMPLIDIHMFLQKRGT